MAETWIDGDTVRRSWRTEDRIPVFAGLFNYSGFGMGTVYLPGGEARWCSSTTAAALCRDAGVKMQLHDWLKDYTSTNMRD